MCCVWHAFMCKSTCMPASVSAVWPGLSGCLVRWQALCGNTCFSVSTLASRIVALSTVSIFYMYLHPVHWGAMVNSKQSGGSSLAAREEVLHSYWEWCVHVQDRMASLSTVPSQRPSSSAAQQRSSEDTSKSGGSASTTVDLATAARRAPGGSHAAGGSSAAAATSAGELGGHGMPLSAHARQCPADPTQGLRR